MDTRSLKNVLPHGSGIDCDWEVIDTKKDSVLLKNYWHKLNQNGYYIGYIDFTIRVNADGSFEYPHMNPKIFIMEHPAFAKEIAGDCLENEDDVDELSKSDILHCVTAEFNIISDIINSDFENVNKLELGKAVTDYIDENYDKKRIRCKSWIDVFEVELETRNSDGYYVTSESFMFDKSDVDDMCFKDAMKYIKMRIGTSFGFDTVIPNSESRFLRNVMQDLTKA